MFEKASRMKLRFATNRGELTVEDLWLLPLTSDTGKLNLDAIACDLHKQLRNDADVSFVNPEKKSDAVIQLKFDIVKHVIEVLLEESKAKAVQADMKQRRDKLLRILADKEDEALLSKTPEQLREELAKLA